MATQDSRFQKQRTAFDNLAPIREARATETAFPQFAADIRRDVLVAAGLWPEPERTPLNAVIHGQQEFDGYSVAKVYFEDLPGNFVTGSLFRPHPLPDTPMPVVASPYGHWPQGRFMDYADRTGRYGAEDALTSGGETNPTAARSLLQARCVQLARMGCAVLLYDMNNRADATQLPHAPVDPERWEKPGTGEEPGWLLESPQALQHLHNEFGLQVWKGIRVVDFLTSLPGTDPDRVFVTGASGGGKYTIYQFAADPRVTAGVAGVALGGGREEAGCVCGKAPYLLATHGLVDLVASGAPRPFAFAGSDGQDGLRDNVLPYLQKIYGFFDAADDVEFFLNHGYGHQYNLHARRHMYDFVNRHLDLGLTPPVDERDFTFLTEQDLTVWNDEHPAPARRGPEHEKAVTRWLVRDAQSKIQPLLSPATADQLRECREIVGGGWQTILGRTLPEAIDVKLVRGQEVQPFGGVQGTQYLAKHTRLDEVVNLLALKGNKQPDRVLLIVSPEGIDGLFTNKNGSQVVRDKFQAALDSGAVIAGIDLILQTDSVATGPGSPGQQIAPNWGKPRRAKAAAPSAVYAHNTPLYSLRVNDILTAVAALKADAQLGQLPLELVATPGAAHWGAGALAAMAGQDPLDRATLHLTDFRFDDVTDVFAADFVPGSVKYGDMTGLLLQSAGEHIEIHGADPTQISILNQAWTAAGQREALETK